MKVYIAGQFNTKDQRRQDARVLEEYGITVTSRWMYETVPHTASIKDLPDTYHAETAAADLEDIDRADALLMFIPTDKELVDTPLRTASRGGRHFEMGYAYRAGIMIYVIGNKENVFHFLPSDRIRHFGSLVEFISYIRATILV
jgi:nucleoside 2-deoxyribosyltransferase